MSKIKNKIKALLSKTVDNGATKEEMESALTKANQLMIEFFISEHDLKDSEIINKCVSESFELTKSGFDLTLFYADLATSFDCKFFFNKERITFFGYEEDVALCGYFYTMISKTCLKEKDAFLKTEKYVLLKKYRHGRTLASSFIKGFLVEVILKLRKMYQDRKKNIPETYGLMVIEKEKRVNDEFMDLKLKIRTKKQAPIKGERQAFEYGLRKGEEVALIQGIEESETKDKLKSI